MKPSRLVFLIVLLGTAVSQAEEHTQVLVDMTYGSADRCPKVAAGRCTPTGLGLLLAGNSRIDLTHPQAQGLRTGSIDVSFVPPHVSGGTAPLDEDTRCPCAFKVRTGRAEVEFSDSWLRIQRYGEGYTDVAELVAEQPLVPVRAISEHRLRIALDRGAITATLNDTIRLRARIAGVDLGDVHIATYLHAYHVTAVRIEARRYDRLRVDTSLGVVEVAARYHPTRFTDGPGLKNHHFVVWEGGRAADNALFSTLASDSAVALALVAAGGVPGDNLTKESWTKRRSARSPDPDLRVEGSPITLKVVYGDQTFPAENVLRDLAGKRYALRFGGHLHLVPVWHSGCVVCLQSCPGGKVSNCAYTMRDLAADASRFAIAEDLPFTPEDEVLLRLSVGR